MVMPGVTLRMLRRMLKDPMLRNRSRPAFLRCNNTDPHGARKYRETLARQVLGAGRAAPARELSGGWTSAILRGKTPA
jgi:hypothetical protein